MSVKKFNGYGAPYRSATFRSLSHALTQANRLLNIEGAVSQSGSNVSVPALSFIQEGLVVKKDSSTTLSSPSLEAPYYLAVSSPSLAPRDDLNFFFVKSPHDISHDAVTVASYDGSQWTTKPSVSLEGLSSYFKDLVVDLGQPGGLEGLETTASTGGYTLSSGSLFDTSGDKVTFEEGVGFTRVEDDSDLGRVDRIIYRRGKDSGNRLGERSYLAGTAYASSVSKLYEAQAGNTASVRQRVKVLIKPDNKALVLHAEGYGDSLVVTGYEYSSDRQTKLSTFTVSLGLTSPEFDVSLDSTGKLHFVYEKYGNICYRNWTSPGTLGGEVLIESGVATSSMPRCHLSPSNEIFVVYQSKISVSETAVMFSKRASDGSVLVAPKNISNSGDQCETPSLFVEDDLRVHVAWRNASTNKIWYGIFDDAGFEKSRQVVSDGVFDCRSSSTASDSLAAKIPEIVVAPNRSPIISFTKEVSGEDVSVALWTGDGAFIPSGLASMTGTSGICLFADPISCDPFISVSHGSGARFFKVAQKATVFSESLSSTCQRVYSARDIRGAIFHSWTAKRATETSTKQSGLKVDYIGPFTVAGSLSTVSLDANQCLIRKTASTTRPVPEETLILSGTATAGNALSSPITSSETVSINAANDFYKVTLEARFAAPADETLQSATAQTKSPNGNEIRTAKSAGELQVRAYGDISPDTDVVLSKILRPQGLIRNWTSRNSKNLGFDTLALTGSASLDWGVTESGSFTIGSGLSLIDLYNNQTFSVASGTYPVADGDALYIEITGSGGTLTPTAGSYDELPWGSRMAILGIRSGSQFSGMLLGRGGFGQLDSPEQVVFGQDLSSIIRSRLGIESDTAFEAYTSSLSVGSGSSYPAAISKLDLMSSQNPHIRLTGLEGDWGATTSGSVTISQVATVLVPGLSGTRNQIAAQTIALGDGEAAYCNLNRSSGPDATLSVAKTSSLTPGRDTFVLFRRIGLDLLLESTGQRIPHGSSFSRNTDTTLKGIRVVDVFDNTVSSAPTSSTTTVVGTSVTDGMRVLFGHASLNKVYLARKPSSTISWEALPAFGGRETPSDGDHCFVKASTLYPNGMDYFYKSSSGWSPVLSPSFGTQAVSGGSLSVFNAATAGSFSTTGATSTGTLSVTNWATAGSFSTTGATSTGSLSVTNGATAGSFSTTGATSTGTLSVAGNTTIGGATDVSGKISGFTDTTTIGASINKPAGSSWKRVAGWEYTNYLSATVYGGGQFVAVGTSGIIATSPDGEVWTSRNNPSTATLKSVAYGIGQYVAVGSGGSVVVSSDGVIWKTVTSVTAQNLNRVIYGGGRFVAVGNSGTILTSSDGFTWTSRTAANRTVVAQTGTGTSPVSSGNANNRYTIQDATPNIFSNVLAGDRLTIISTVAFTTNDGSLSLGTYTVQSVSGDTLTMTTNMVGASPSILLENVTYKIERINIHLNDVSYNGTTYVAAGDSGTLQVSADSTNWSIPSTTNSLKYSNTAIEYGNSRFVVFGYATGTDTSLLNSTDGFTWSSQTSPATTKISSIAWSGSGFVAAGTNGTIWTSATGIGGQWTQRTSGTTSEIRGISYGNSKWVAAVATNVVSSTLTSSDSVTWKLNQGDVGYISGGVYANGKYVVVGSSGLIFSSLDGITWAAVSGQSASFNSIAYGGGVFAAVGYAGAIATSTNGDSWTTRTYSSSTNFNSVTWYGTKFVAVGYSASQWVSATSSDGTSWAQSQAGSGSLNGVASGPSGMVAVGNTGLVLTTTDGATWVSRTSGTTLQISAVTYGNNQFVAAGQSGLILTSPDGVSWTSRSSGETNSFYAVAYGKNSYVAVGNAGAVRTSQDAVSWKSGYSASPRVFNSVFYGNGKYICAGNYATIQTSSEAVAIAVSEGGGLFRGDGAQAIRPVFEKPSIQLLSANQGILAEENNIIYIANSATAMTVYLSSVVYASELGVTLRFKNIGSGTLTIKAYDGEYIDSSATLSLSQYARAQIMAYPTMQRWYTLSQ